MTRADLADTLTRFIGTGSDCGGWEWDDFMSGRAPPELEPFRQRLLIEVDPMLEEEAQLPELRARVTQIISELRAHA